MRIAIQIAEAMEERHISKKELAKMMGRQPSEITKWLSGDQNFTSDTLAELSYYLNAKITGEVPESSYTYINVFYDSSMTIDLPKTSISAGLNSHRKWNDLDGQQLRTIVKNY